MNLVQLVMKIKQLMIRNMTKMQPEFKMGINTV